MSFVLTEYDIFKHVVMREESSIEDVKARTRQLLSRVPINIFDNVYYIIYKSLEQADRFNVALSYDHLHHMIVNNVDDIIKEDKVSLFSEGEYTDAERADKIIDFCLVEYDELSEAEIEDEGSMNANIEFYVETWGKQKIREITHTQLDILDDGVRVDGKLYKGIEDSKAYYDKAYTVVRSLIEADANALSENIDTSVDDYETVSAKLMEEENTETITGTGIDKLDNYYDYHKGEIVVIQAGTGVGKTRFTANMAYNGLAKNNNVLYVSLEQKSSRVFPMLHSRHILEKYADYPDIDDKTLIRRTYNYDRAPIIEESLRDMLDSPEMGKVRVEGRSIEADELYSYLVKVWEEGFHFDILVLDYLGLLETRGGNRYEKLTNAINMIKTECKSFKGKGFLALIPNQLTPDAELKLAQGDIEGMTKTGGSETQYVARAADYIYTLEQDEIMKRMDKMRVHVSKVRLGDIHSTKVDAIVDLGKMLFIDDEDEEDDDY